MAKVSNTPSCTGCPLAQILPNNNFVGPQVGKTDRLLVGEAAGESEDAIGRPFCGGAGKWLDAMLSKANIKRDDVWITNCLSCRPKDNIFPTDPEGRSYISKEDADKAVQHCYKAHVEPILRGRPWKRIDLLGDKALRIVGQREGGIYRWRGSPISIPALGPELKAIATLHPAALMRDQTMIPVAINDLAKSLVVAFEHYSLYPSIEEVTAFQQYTSFALDIETNMSTGEIVMVGLCATPFFAMAVPFRGHYITLLKQILANAKQVIGHNIIAFDGPYLAKHGVPINKNAIVWDTMLLHHLLFPDFPHDLGFVGSQLTNKPAWKELPRPDYVEFARYCCRDTDVTLQCFNQLFSMAKQEHLDRLYSLVQVPLALICHKMHDQGFKIDRTKISKVRERLTVEMAELELRLPEALRTQQVPIRKRVPAPPGTRSEKTGKPLKYLMVEDTELVVPWRSGKTKQDYLYNQLQLPKQTHSKTGKITVDKTGLEKLARKVTDPTIRTSIRAISELMKKDELMTTFCKEGNLKVEAIHSNFNTHGTNSGRLSSSDPNCQNIPESVRHLYVPSKPNHVIVSVDYSGIENRLSAYFANDDARLNRFLTIPEFSEHKYLASKISGIPYEQIKKSTDPESIYSKAKHVVHGFNYGLGVKKCSMMYDMDFKETKELFAFWAGEIPKTVAWREETAARAKKEGVLTTPFGRKRWFWTSSYYTESLSFLPQSTAADIIFRAMIGLMYEKIGWPLSKVLEVVRVAVPLPGEVDLLLQVHDSLVFQCPKDMVPELVGMLHRVMEQPWPELGGFSIPIAVEVGPSWGEAVTYKLSPATNIQEANKNVS